jgi:hypothetical protein
MKPVGATLFAAALALLAGCSSGSSASSPVDEAAQRTERLVAPSPDVPEDDPCASVRCAAGTECVVVDGNATCAETDVNPCAAVLCLVGTLCEVIDGQASCTPIEPTAPQCGGFAGFACPGSGTCVDDTTDDCDPANGGADCSGVCECNILALCIEGFVFDPSPAVCACVEAPEVDPCAAVRCGEGTECVVVDGSATCQPAPNPCALVLCPPNAICEVVDGDAVCAPIEPPPFCGGFANIQCPGAGTCVDDATDGCDPANGGFDCGGVCECNILALCIEGFAFDSSPAVCACVEAPELDPCAAVRCAAGFQCIVVDGSASCESPCNLVDCIPDTICKVVEGEAVCVPPDAPACDY